MNKLNYDLKINFFCFKILIFFFAFLPFYSLSSHAQNEEKKYICPSSHEITEQISQRISVLNLINSKLLELYNGKLIEDFSASSLFTVDLSDSSLVQKRVKELQSDLKQNDFEIALRKHQLYSCVARNKQILEKLKTLINLEIILEKNRLNFLQLTSEKRQSLLSLQEQGSFHSKNVQTLELKKEEASLRSENADEALKNAEEQAQTAKSSYLRDLAGARALLEKARKDIADLNVKMAEKYKELSFESNEHTKILTENAAILGHKEASNSSILVSYFEVTRVWRKLLSYLFLQLKDFSNLQSLPELPPYAQDLVQKVKDDPVAKEYENSYNEAKKELQSLSDLKTEISQSNRNSNYKLILLAGKVRAQLIEEMAMRKMSDPFEINDINVSDFLREIRLIPYRPVVLIKTVLIETKILLTTGITGLISLLKAILTLLLFLLIPIASYWLVHRASEKIDLLKSKLLNSRNNRKNAAATLAIWINRLNPYFPWFMMLVGTKLAAAFIHKTPLETIGEILPYFQIYFYYRLFRIALGKSATYLSEFVYPSLFAEKLSFKIEKTGKLIGYYFLFSSYILEATEAATRRALFFHVVAAIIWWTTPLVLATAAYWWKNEITSGLKKVLPEKLFSQFQVLMQKKWSWLFSLPSLAVLILS